MKLSNILTGIILVISSVVFAQPTKQDTLIQHYYKYPQQAILDAEKMYRQAIHEHNNPLLIKALVLKTTFTLERDHDKYPQCIRELEDYIAKERDSNVKSILHSYIGQLYSIYYNRNRYKIDKRSQLMDVQPDNMDAWSSNLFLEQIYRHLWASLAPEQKLQQTPVSAFNMILIQGAASDSLRPTLYDFLCHRAINLFTLNSRQQTSTLTGSSEILANTEIFLRWPIAVEPLDAPSHILKIWQELLAFHQQTDSKNAFLMANLGRLQYARQISTNSNADSLYQATLRKMEKQYADNPMVIEIMADQANCLIRSHSGISPLTYPLKQNEKLRLIKEQALAICEKGLQLYPKYNRINILNNIINTIKAPYIKTEFPKTIYPGDKLPIQISSANISKTTISIYRIGLSSIAYDNLKNKKGAHIPKKLVYQQNYSLANDLIPRDTSFEITNLPAGLLEVVIKTPGAKENISKNVICTQLFASNQMINSETNFLVCDWQTGKPVSQAKVVILNKYQKHTQTDTLYTNQKGTAKYKTGKAYSFYEIVNPENPAGNIEQIYNRYYSPKAQTRIDFITDRKIYRPGQTVYFKGIVWEETTDRIYALNKKSYEIIFRDANRKEISKKQVTTNRFGTFNGSFVIPSQTLNGRFSISTGSFTTDITVAEYKRPEFEIVFAKPTRSYYMGDTIQVKGKVSSFSGVSLSNTIVKYDISTQNHYYRLSTSPKNIQGVITTDLNGEFDLTFKAESFTPNKDFHLPYTYNITATVTDSKGETQKGETSIIIYPGLPAPVLEIPRIVNKDKRTAFNIILPDISTLDQKRKVKYAISKLVTPTRLNQPLDTVVEQTILKGELQMGYRDSLLPALQNQASGAYLFTAQSGNEKADHIFLLYSSQDKRPPIPTYDWLVEEKTTCKPGETARVQFGTSAKDAYVMYAIYTPNRLVQEKSVILSDEILNIEFPFSKEYGNQIWLTIRYIKDKKYIDHDIPIHRAHEPKTLNIQTTVFRDKLQPGQKEKWEIKVLSDKNKPVIAEVLAMMYDASLDRLMPNILSLKTNYLYQDFPYFWNSSYAMNSFNYMSLSSWSFKQKRWPVPSFHFDELNLYKNRNSPPPPPSPKLLGAIRNMTAEVSNDQSFNSSPESAIMIRGLSKTAAGATEGSSPEIELRQNFQETAFFYPQLQTDSAGNVAFQFTIPESLTKWKFVALATTPDMSVGQIERYITTSKPLMVRPNLPRFLRSGDITEIKASISNLSDSVRQGMATLEFFTPGNHQVIFKANRNFNIPAGQSQTVNFGFNVPENTDLLGIRITAVTDRFSDGEQNLIAVLPNETLLTETLPIYTTSAGEHSYTLKKTSPGKNNYRLTLEATANPIWYAVLALPSLTEPKQENATDISAAYYVNAIASLIARSNPQITKAIQNWNAKKDTPDLLSKLEQNKELKSILLDASPWVIQAQNENERMQTLAQLFDQNRLNYLQQQALEKLSGLQTQEGGWGWFKGMQSNRFITLNVLTIMSRTTMTGQHENGEKEKGMQIKALRYLDNNIKRDFEKTPKRINYDQILYLYTRSLYRDIPLGDALEAHKHFLSLAQKQWSEFSLYEKAILSITLKNYGFITEARDILKSLRQYATTTPEAGMFWPNNKNTFYRNSAVQIHTAIMEAFQTIEGNSTELNLMKKWLLRQKQVQSWAGVPATVDAIYALLLTGNDELAKSEQLEIKLGQHEFKTGTAGNPLGYIKESYSSREIKPNMFTVRITKHNNSPSWGGLYLQYFEKLDQVKEQKTDISINKELFISKPGKNGKAELMPVERQSLKTGDRIIVRLTLSLKQDMEFLHLKDLRAACFEPADQLSGNQWKFGTVYYQETKDAVTNFFFNALSRGIYVIEYAVWVNQTGTYQDGIATLQSIYAPEYNAYSKATQVIVKQ